MAELHVIGEIHSAESFDSNKSLFCRYSFNSGPNWSLISGQVNGQTCSDSPLYEGAHNWSHPIDLHYITKGVQGWPILLIQVHCVDSLGRSWLEGYSSISIPKCPGQHSLVLPCWRPRASTFYESLSQYFLGGSAQLTHPDTLASAVDRYKLKAISTGKVNVNLYIVLKNFTKFGIEYK